MSKKSTVSFPFKDVSQSFKLLTPVPFRSLGTNRFFKPWHPKPDNQQLHSNQNVQKSSRVDTSFDANLTHAADTIAQKPVQPNKNSASHPDKSLPDPIWPPHNPVTACQSLDRQRTTQKAKHETISGAQTDTEATIGSSKSIGAWFEKVQQQSSPKKGGLVWATNTTSHQRVRKTRSLYELKTQDQTFETMHQSKEKVKASVPQIDRDGKQISVSIVSNRHIPAHPPTTSRPPRPEPSNANSIISICDSKSGNPSISASRYDEFKTRATSQTRTHVTAKLNQPPQPTSPVPLINSNTKPTINQNHYTLPTNASEVVCKTSATQKAPENIPSGKAISQHNVNTNARDPQQGRNMSHQTPHNYPHFSSDVKSQSLPGFYSRPTHQQQGLRDGFAANRISFFETATPPPQQQQPNNTIPHHDAVDRAMTQPEEKKSRPFFEKIFSRKKKTHKHVSATSSDSEDFAQQTNWLSKRMRRTKLFSSASSVAPAPQQNPALYREIPHKTPPVHSAHPQTIHATTQKVPHTLGVPVLPTAHTREMSVSYDSLPVSPRSYNSESAYGSINSISYQSQMLGGGSSSTDTLTRKERREALMARVEKLRSQKDSSSEDEMSFSSHSRSNSASGYRSSRTERYIRRKSQESECLRRESEKDKRSKAAVEARIKEIQNVKLREEQRSLLQSKNMHNEEVRPRWSARLVYQESNEFDEVVLGTPNRFNPMRSNQMPKTHAEVGQHHPSSNQNFTQKRAAPLSQNRESESSRQNGNNTILYGVLNNKSSSLPPNSPPGTLRNVPHVNSHSCKISPTPPRRHSSRFLSPQSPVRPVSYSFEDSKHDCTHTPIAEPSYNKSPCATEYDARRTKSYQHMSRRASSEQRQIHSRKNDGLERHRQSSHMQPEKQEPIVWSVPQKANEKHFHRRVPSGYPADLNSRHQSSQSTVLVANMPPSPSSDYSSGVSENSSKWEQAGMNISEDNPFDQLNAVLRSEPYCTKPISCHKIASSSNSVSNQNILNKRGKEKIKESRSLPNRDSSSPHIVSRVVTNNTPANISMRRDKLVVGTPEVPEPPKRNSSNLTKDTREMLALQLHMLHEQSEPKGPTSSSVKNLTNECFPKKKTADFEQAIKELEDIYKHLNLNIDNILEGAERRDLPTDHQLMWCQSTANANLSPPEKELEQRGRSRTPRARKSATPDRAKDDFHFRRCHSTGPVNRKKRPNHIGSYMLVSPVHGPPPEAKEPCLADFVTEPDIITDDLWFRNIHKANSQNNVASQPPFGVPIGPVTQSSPSDYLHCKVKNNFKPLMKSRMSPDVTMDDMAFRNLRKDNSFTKSVNLSGLDEALSEFKRPFSQHVRLRSSSVDRTTINQIPTHSSEELLRLRQVRHLPKNKSKKKFSERFKEALTDSENTVTKNNNAPQHACDTESTDHAPMTPNERPDIREALIAQSRNPCGGKPLVPFSLTVDEKDFETLTMRCKTDDSMSTMQQTEHLPLKVSQNGAIDLQDCPKKQHLNSTDQKGNCSHSYETACSGMTTDTVVSLKTPVSRPTLAEHVFLFDSTCSPTTNPDNFHDVSPSSPNPLKSPTETSSTSDDSKEFSLDHREKTKSGVTKACSGLDTEQEVNLLHSVITTIPFVDFPFNECKINNVYPKAVNLLQGRSYFKVINSTPVDPVTIDQMLNCFSVAACLLTVVLPLADLDVFSVFFCILGIVSFLLTFTR